MRFVIYGAGAVGGVVGARLAQAGEQVALIARGNHLDAITADGLRLVDAAGSTTLRLPAAPSPAALKITDDDVVLLTMKSQHTAAALDDLRAANPRVPVVCMQNGVANERAALRRFASVLATVVVLPAEHLRPGEVVAFSAPTTGSLDTGRYPVGVDDLTTAVVRALVGAGFGSLARPDVMRWKYAKLRVNLDNVLQLLCGRTAATEAVLQRLTAEADRCFAAAGIEAVTAEEDARHRRGLLDVRDLPGHPRQGGSSWQSAVRGTGNVETDYLNGEVVLLGRTHGIPVPANETVCRLAAELVANGGGPGSWAPADLLAALPD